MQNTVQDTENDSDASPDIFEGDSWFASVTTAQAIQEIEGCFRGIVKTAHILCPKEEIEEIMKPFPGGTHMVMESQNDNGSKIYAIGYKYSSKNVLCFIATEGCGSTKPGIPYEARWTDRHGNVQSRNIPRPYIVSQYFCLCNAIDCHNQARQFEL